MLMQLGEQQIVTVTGSRVVGLRIAGGALLWQYPWHTNFDVSAAQPLQVAPNRFVISAGYGHGAALVEVANGKATTIWENKLLKNKFNSSVLQDGFLYGLDENILSCIDIGSGQRKWKGGRYGYGQVALAQGHLIITAESGEVILVIHWKGGVHTELRLPRRRRGHNSRRSPPELIEAVRLLAKIWADGAYAGHLID